MSKILNSSTILTEDTFYMKPVGSTFIKPARFPGLGQNHFRRNGVNNTNIGTKAAIVNQLEMSLIDSPGELVPAIAGLPHLALVTDHPEWDYKPRHTSIELPHRAGAGAFALTHDESPWNFPELLHQKMTEVGPYNALAYYDPISCLFGCWLSHYRNIPTIWSKFKSAVDADSVATNTQQIVTSAVTRDPMGSNGKELGLSMFASGSGKASEIGMGNIIHLENDVEAEDIIIRIRLQRQRLRFYKPPIRDLLTEIYKYSTLKRLSEGFDLRAKCYLKTIDSVEFDEKSHSRKIQSLIKKCKKENLLAEESLERNIPIELIK